MKRISNIWQNAVNVDTAAGAIVDGIKNKHHHRDVERLLLYDAEDVAEDPTKWHVPDPQKVHKYAEDTVHELAEKRWTHKRPKSRMQYCRSRTSGGGKWRKLYEPSLKDHCVQHIVIKASKKAFLRGMHPHCCGNVEGRGIRLLVRLVNGWMKHDKECRYFVKLDIRHFFDTIDKDILKAMLRKKIKDKDILWTFDQIIDSADVACPIGYYSSPWLANLYLEPLDWYMAQQLYKSRRGKRINYIRHFVRYVDDILLMGSSKADLEKAVYKIEGYLGTELHLELKKNWEVKAIGKHVETDGKWCLKPGTYWADIGGYKFCKDSTTLRDGIYLSTSRLARKIHKNGYMTEGQARSIVSRVGWAKWCDSSNFMKNNVLPYVNIKRARRVISDVEKKRK